MNLLDVEEFGDSALCCFDLLADRSEQRSNVDFADPPFPIQHQKPESFIHLALITRIASAASEEGTLPETEIVDCSLTASSMETSVVWIALIETEHFK